MQIKMLKTQLVHLETFEKDQIVDLQISGETKNELVEKGIAMWHVPAPKVKEKKSK